MKGKNKHNKLKPIMKKSMLAALGLGIALPLAGSLPHANATLPESNLVISEPVLNSGISWLSISSKNPMENSVPILVGLDNRITIDLSTHFPWSHYGSISAISSNENIATVDVINDDNASYKLVVTPHARGLVNIELKAHYKLSEESNLESEIITDTIELHISKKGDLTNDGKVDSTDAVELLKYLRNMQFGKGFSNVDMNKADIDRNGVPDKKNDMEAFLDGYVRGKLGVKDNSHVLTFQQVDDAPYALNGKLIGTMKTQETITGTYTHLDVDGYQSKVKYQWYTAADPDGTGEELIEGETSEQYKIRDIDAGQFLVLKITPVNYYNDQLEGKPLVIRGTEAIKPMTPP
ncbi:dockerin type I domain-containing protein [Paenibacillus amylolyticus]|uniref:dockerin type I domain-containing protein n=1 Tax=Paenibacillus amylolyticus TaxID=1451 RepID=UPI003EBDC890